MPDRPEVRILIVRAKQLHCEYRGKGDSCDDHRAKGTPDFTPCDPCVVRRIAEHADRGGH